MFAKVPEISVTPSSALADEEVSINVRGLKPNQPVTFESTTLNTSGRRFVAYAHYVADSKGCIDFQRDTSVGGDFGGVEPMGLFSFLRLCAADSKTYSKLLVLDIRRPFVITINLYSGHLDKHRVWHSTPFLVTSVERWFVNESVDIIPVYAGRVRGTLYLPKGPGPHPGVIAIAGGGVTTHDRTSGLLACHGFAAMSLLYHGRYDLPKKYDLLEMEYFEEAVAYMTGHGKISKEIGVIGYSMGGTIALAMAGCHMRGVKCVANLGGLVYTAHTSLSYGGKLWPKGHSDISKTRIENGAFMLRDNCTYPSYADLHKYMPPFHMSKATILVVYGGDDKTVNTEASTRLALNSMKSSGKKNYEIVTYPGCGHILEPAYYPMRNITYFRSTDELPVDFGGTNREVHIKAQAQIWWQTINFLDRNLRNTSKL